MKTTTRTIRIQAYTDEGKPVCGACIVLSDESVCDEEGLKMERVPGPSCPIWGEGSKEVVDCLGKGGVGCIDKPSLCKKKAPYKLVHSTNIDELELLVSDLIVKGWSCVGGVSVTMHYHSGEHNHFYQAMIKEVKDNE